MADQFICIADESKYVAMLGAFPLPIEVIPMARSYVARELVKLGGHPELRQGVTTDNGNVILDVHGLKIRSRWNWKKSSTTWPAWSPAACSRAVAPTCWCWDGKAAWKKSDKALGQAWPPPQNGQMNCHIGVICPH